jgi:hypothetical protein
MKMCRPENPPDLKFELFFAHQPQEEPRPSGDEGSAKRSVAASLDKARKNRNSASSEVQRGGAVSGG